MKTPGFLRRDEYKGSYWKGILIKNSWKNCCIKNFFWAVFFFINHCLSFLVGKEELKITTARTYCEKIQANCGILVKL